MSTILKNPPVFHTLVQIRFDENPQLKEAIDAIHKDFYAYGFTEKQEEQIQEIEIPTTPHAQPQIKSTTSWHFINLEQDAGFTLTSNFIIFHTTNHRDSGLMLEQLKLAFNILSNHLDFLVITRIGIRYLNAIIDRENTGIENFLSDSSLNVTKKIGLDTRGFEIKHALNEKILFNEENKQACIIRVVSANLNNPFPIMPQDLAPLIQRLKIKEKFRNINCNMVLLDLDSAVDLKVKSTTIDADECVRIALELHDNIETAFKGLVNIQEF